MRCSSPSTTLLARSAKDLLALSVGVGLKMLDELLEEDLLALVGPKGRRP